MIDSISARELRHLSEAGGDHCVSIYLPTHRAGEETAQDSIRLKNLVSAAAAELKLLGRRPSEVDGLLSEISGLPTDGAFWANLGLGLAAFVNQDGTNSYRLVDPVGELMVVADRFHMKPLLPSVESSRSFVVLALSQNRVRLLRGDRVRLEELPLGSIPESLAVALRFDDREPQLHSHSAGRVGTGQVVAALHGQGGHKDTHDVDLTRFLRAVDAGIPDAIDDGSTPLVLAGVDTVVAHFRLLTRAPNLVDGSITGNTDRLSPAELHAQAWPLVSQVFAADRDRARATFTARSAPVVDDLVETLIAATHGRVQHLFVAAGVQQWGRFDPGSQLVEERAHRQPGDRDLLDVAAVETFAHGGRVFVVDPAEVPGEGKVAAVLRF